MKKSLLGLMAIVVIAVSQSAMAWNSVGHMTVAYVAYQRLTPAEKARVKTLLQLNPYYSKWIGYIRPGTTDADRDMYVFMMAATWPDEIKAMGSRYVGNDNAPHAELAVLNTGYSDLGAHKYWHFVNTPLVAAGTVAGDATAPTLPNKIGVFRAALTSDVPDAVKSYDLVWLLHLVGDAHQPLHCVTRVTADKPHGDDGGNLVLVNGPAKELHAFWDGALGDGDTKDFMIAVKVGQDLPPPDAALLAIDQENAWAAESFALAKTSVYVAPVSDGLGPYTMTAEYTANMERIARDRVALAGARLANALKTALQCGVETCAH